MDMRQLLTAITTTALALSLVAGATPAAAVTGYDSAYAGESAFLNLAPGESGSFTVFFVNSGSTAWARSSASQVDLAACLEDKVTCDQQDPAEAAFRSGWLSGTRYATHAQSSVGPGQAATFTYGIRVPLTAAAGTYTFNGALVVSASGQDVHNEGYFQQVTVSEPALIPDLSSLEPEEGSVAGGQIVVIMGSDFVCSPAPTVDFGDQSATLLSCGSSVVTVRTPAADAPGTVDVTVTNANGEESDKLQFTYEDDVAPTFESVAVSGQDVTLEFSEPICLSDDLTDPEDISIKVNGAEADWLESSLDAPFCADDETADSFTLSIEPEADGGADIVEGDSVSVTITSAGADEIEDAAGNAMDKARTRSTEAGADETEPEVTEAVAGDDDELTLTASEPLDCDAADADDFVFDPDDADLDEAEATDVACDGDEIVLTFPGGTFADGVEGKIDYDGGANDIQDLAGNDLADFRLAITPFEGTGDVTIEDARATPDVGLRNQADDGDTIKLTFSEAVTDPNDDDGFLIRVKDSDGTIADITCTGVVGADDGVIDAECTRDPEAEDSDELVWIELLEDPVGDTLVAGDLAGLQFPATIIDITGYESVDDGDPVDLEGSADVTINAAR